MFYCPAIPPAEQQFFEKVKRLEQCQEEFVSQTQEHHKLREEFSKLGKSVNKQGSPQTV